MPNYDYDVFLSYKKSPLKKMWVKDIFFDLFSDCLEDSIGRKPKIFLDESDLDGARDWSVDLKNNLAHSKCMVSIWSSVYFNVSEGWLCELVAMAYRQQKIGWFTIANPNTLIIPVYYNKLDQILEFVRNIQLADLIKKIQGYDFSNYNSVGEEFKRTARYLEMQDIIRDRLAPRVARIINAAPSWDPAW